MRQLSADGARIESDRVLEINDHVGVYFFTENVTLMAKVVWLNGGTAGLSFDRPVPWLAWHVSE